MKLIHSPGRRAGKTSECEKHCDYWFRFKEQDGSWSQWYQVDLTTYARYRKVAGPAKKDIQTRVTKKGETP